MTQLDPTQIMTFGDARRGILNDIAAVRRGDLSVSAATAMAALYKEMNTNIQIEINTAKMALQTENTAHAFGKVVEMGKRLIGGAA